METSTVIKQFIVTVWATLLALFGISPTVPEQTPVVQEAQIAIETADTAIASQPVVETNQEQVTTRPEPTAAQAYELGKVVGKLEQQVAQAGNETTPAPSSTVETIVPTQTEPVVTQTQPIIIMNTLEIISPIPGKGLGRWYKASPEIIDESNYIEIGAVVRDGEGEPLKSETVAIKVESPSGVDEKVIDGTGNVVNLYPNGVQTPTAYYPLHLEFKVAGHYAITFTSGELSQSIGLDVVE